MRTCLCAEHGVAPIPNHKTSGWKATVFPSHIGRAAAAVVVDVVVVVFIAVISFIVLPFPFSFAVEILPHFIQSCRRYSCCIFDQR